MPLTTIKGSNIGTVLTNTQLNTTGTASSANVLPGTFAWGAASRSGLTNFAASDPATPALGDIWYQAGYVKFATNSNLWTGVWSSMASTLGTRQGATASGTLDSAMLFCGSGPLSSTESYTGADNAWVNTPNSMLTSRYFPSSFGAQGATVVFGGSDGSRSATAEQWDGVSASATGSLSVAQLYSCGAGTLSAGISMAGEIDTGNAETAATQEYDGTSWSAGGNLSTARYANYGAGTQTAALTWSGKDAPGDVDSSEEYNGTAWAAGGTLTQTFQYGNSQMGTQTAALSAGTNEPPRNQTEAYDGTAWSVQSTMNTGRREGGAAGSQAAGIYASGNSGSATTTSEQWNKTEIRYYDV